MINMGENNKLHPILEGERIVLREVRLSDVNANYHRWMNDPQVTKYLECRFLSCSMDEIKNFVQKMIEDRDNIFLAIILKDGDRHIGNIKIGSINHIHSQADVGLLIGERDCWGKGYATEALRLVATYAFNTLNIHKLVAGCYAVNIGSQKAFTRVGFVVEGIMKEHRFFEGRFVDSLLFGLLNSGDNAE
jgi:[ribosomal protein S5]-alanine N-acetyltransferase